MEGASMDGRKKGVCSRSEGLVIDFKAECLTRVPRPVVEVPLVGGLSKGS